MKRTPSRGGNNNGFTVVETLIVLAITSVLFLSAVLLVAGQQRKVEFSQAVTDIESAVKNTISEVSSGYYPSSGNFECQVSGTTMDIVSVPAGSQPQGTNDDCIFLGKAIQFGDAGDANKYNVISLAGLRQNDGSLQSVNPRALNVNNSREQRTLRNGLTVFAMRYMPPSGTPQNISSVAFVNGLGKIANGQLQSGSQQMGMVPVAGSPTVPTATITSTNSIINNGLQNQDNLLNPPNNVRVEICFRGGGEQYAMMTIGGNSRNLSVKIDFKNASCW